MAHWTWQARDRKGQACSGELEADNKREALQALQRLGVYATQIMPQTGTRAKLKVTLSTQQKRDKTTTKPPHSKHVLWLTQQLAFLCNAGLPVLGALDLLRSQPLPAALGALVAQLHAHLQQGQPLPQAFEACNAHRRVFSDAYIGSLTAAQRSGLLGQAFTSLAHQLQFSANLQAQMRSAMAYPAALVLFSVLIVVGLLVFVVPAFELQFAQQDLALPWPTALLLAWSRWLTANAEALVAGALVMWLAVRTWLVRNQVQPSKVHQKLRLSTHKWLLSAPFVGPLLWQLCAAQWAQSCAHLLGTGLPLLDTLGHANNTLPNTYLQRQLQSVQDAVAAGVTLSQALRHAGVFQANLWAVCAVGEATGNMAQALQHISTMLRSELEQQVKTFTSLLEPVAVLVVGALIGAIVLAMYWPIFELGRTV